MSDTEKKASGIIGGMTGGSLGSAAGAAIGALAGDKYLNTADGGLVGGAAGTIIGGAAGAGYGVLKGLEHKRKMQRVQTNENREQRIREVAMMRALEKSSAAGGFSWRDAVAPVSKRSETASAVRASGGGILSRMSKLKKNLPTRSGLEAGANVAMARGMEARASVGMEKAALIEAMKNAVEKGKSLAGKAAEAWSKAEIFGPQPKVAFVQQDGSLTKIAIDLYRKGLVRDEVMKHAADQAAHLKADAYLMDAVKLAGLRLIYFGAESPTLEKLASDAKPLGPMEMAVGGFSKQMGAIGATALAASAIAGARWLIGRESQNIEESYQSMMKSNPEFKKNEKTVRGHFDVLKQFAPSVASNSVAAAGHVRQAVEMGDMIPVDTVRNLAQTEKLYQESGPKSWLSPSG